MRVRETYTSFPSSSSSEILRRALSVYSYRLAGVCPELSEDQALQVAEEVQNALRLRDYLGGGRFDLPSFLRAYAKPPRVPSTSGNSTEAENARN